MALEAKNITVAAGKKVILQNLSFSLPVGKRTAVIGPNGAGKSTTLMSLSGIYPPKEGKITFCGQDITHLNAEETMRLGIVQVPAPEAQP